MTDLFDCSDREVLDNIDIYCTKLVEKVLNYKELLREKHSKFCGYYDWGAFEDYLYDDFESEFTMIEYNSDFIIEEFKDLLTIEVVLDIVKYVVENNSYLLNNKGSELVHRLSNSPDDLYTYFIYYYCKDNIVDVVIQDCKYLFNKRKAKRQKYDVVLYNKIFTKSIKVNIPNEVNNIITSYLN